MLQNDDDASVFAAFLRNTPLPHRFRMVTYTRTPARNCIVYYERVDLSASHDPDDTVVYGKNGLPYRRVCRDDSERIYPINRLRNLAIQSTLTTHFLVLDMDMWPSRAGARTASRLDNLYQELARLPLTMLDSTRAAVIVPAFFLKREEILSKCSSVLSCAKL